MLLRLAVDWRAPRKGPTAQQSAGNQPANLDSYIPKEGTGCAMVVRDKPYLFFIPNGTISS